MWEEREDEEAFSFSQSMVEEIVYSKIRRLKKKILHKKVAKDIEEIYENELEDWYSELARHYDAAGESDEALQYYIKAGGKAEKMFASEDAVDMYEKALEHTETDEQKIDILDKLARTNSLLGRFEISREYLYKIMDLVEEDKHKLHRRIATTYNLQGEWDKTLVEAKKALSKSNIEDKETLKILSLKGWSYMKQGDYEKALQIFKEEERIAERLGIESGRVYHDLGTIYIRLGRLDEAVDLLKKAIHLREKEEELNELHKSLNNLGIAYKDKGDLKKCKEYFEKTLKVVKDHNLISEIPASLNNAGFINVQMGKLDKSIEFYERSIELGKRIGSKENQALSLGNLGDVYSKKGELYKARENILKAIEFMEAMDYSYGLIVDLQYLGSLNIKEGMFEEAEQDFQRSLELSRGCGNRMRGSISLNKLGDLNILKGDLKLAEDYHMKAKQESKEIGAKDIEAYTCDRLAVIKRRKGELDEAEKLHREGLEIAKDTKDDEKRLLNLIGLGEDLMEKDEIKCWDKHSFKLNRLIGDWEYIDIFMRNRLLIARCRMGMKNFEGAEDQIKLALDKSREVRDLTWEAKVIYEYGLLDKKRGEDGTEHFHQALELFQRYGMEWWIEKTKRYLH